jgi:TolB protein
MVCRIQKANEKQEREAMQMEFFQIRSRRGYAARLGVLATFSLVSHAAFAQQTPVTSILQTIDASKPAAQPVTVYQADGNFEAPNWTRDGRSLLFDQAGKIMRIPITGGQPETLNTGAATRCNGSHGLSPDGKWLAISCSTPEMRGSHVFLISPEGGEPKPVSHIDGAYFHSWAPDSKSLLFMHPDGPSLNFYSVGIDGANEHAVTSGTGVSDDPDYSPDGQYIYFCSDRSGTVQIWRIKPDGTSPEQITNDDRVNWTAHPSPDGSKIAYISYEHGTTGHPSNRSVILRVMDLKTRSIRDAVSLTGGSGTMNVNSWSPDSKHFAFVGYQLRPAPSPAAAAPPVPSH